MRFITLVSLATCLAPFAWAQDTDLKVVQAYFEKYNIPTDLNINFKATALLNAYLPQKDGSAIAVNVGDNIPRNATVGPPRFVLKDGPVIAPVDSKPHYVIIAVDPDAPTPENPTNGQIRHFLGGDFIHPDVSVTPVPYVPYVTNSTVAVTDYVQPTPPASALGTEHRYIFLVYKQSKEFKDQKLVGPKTPINLWNVAKFAEAVGLGDPIGGTFFLVKPDLSPVSPL